MPSAEPSRLPPAPPASARERLAVLAAHVVVALCVFGGVLSGRLLFFRDLSTFYAPWYAFASEALRQGVWPLWNPTLNGGQPFLLAYPVDLLLLLGGGWHATLGVGQALQLLVALTGMTVLARRLGMGPWGSWLAGAVYGAGGFLLSLVDLGFLFEAAAWAPWVVAAYLAALQHPGGRRLAAFSALLALQTSTLGAEVVLQTALVAVVLGVGVRRPPVARMLRVGIGGGLLAALLAAPALLGARALVEGTARAAGFSETQRIGFSLRPAVLLEAVLPHWLGSVHAFSDADYWGRAYFPEGFPYFVTLYLGVPLLLLAAQARRPRRLWALAVLGTVLATGAHEPLVRAVGLPLRGPQKFFFLTHLSLALLAGFGLERREREPPAGSGRAVLFLLPGIALTALSLGLRLAPGPLVSLGSRALAALSDPRAAVAARTVWPEAWLVSGLLALAAGLAVARGGRFVRLAALVTLADLLTVNANVCPMAPASFYELRPDLASLYRPMHGADRGRVYSYGVAQTPGLRFEPVMAGAPSDVWLYYLDRQSLLPPTPALDELDSAFDLDRVGWAPPQSTFTGAEAVPERFRECQRRLRGAAVRWIVSFRELPPDLVVPRGERKLPEVRQPLRLYELREALPRAYYVRDYEVVRGPADLARRLQQPDFDPARTVLLERPPPSRAPSGTAMEARVRYEPVDAHTVRIHARTPPGLIVVLDGYHADWMAEDGTGPVPLLRANGRYRALPTPGGERVFTLRYRPRWRAPAVSLAVLGALVGLVLAFGGPTLRFLRSMNTMTH
jgi:hypothetical protein